jgi:hypothetical protein
MAAHTKVGVGYNIQVAVDAKNKMIVDQEVTNQVVDMSLLTQTAEPARTILEVETIDDRRSRLLQDRGHRGLREGGDDAVCSQAPAGIIGEQWLCPQG